MKLYELHKGDKIISADNRIWEIVGHDFPFTRLSSGGSKVAVWTTENVKKINGGYIILKGKE